MSETLERVEDVRQVYVNALLVKKVPSSAWSLVDKVIWEDIFRKTYNTRRVLLDVGWRNEY